MGAWIDGPLILQFARARGQTVLNACHFTDKPDLTQARLHLLNLQGSRLPGLFAQGMVVKGSVFLRKLTATGTVDVNGTRVGGQLSLIGAGLDGKEGEALNAQRVTVGQDLFLSDLTAIGTIDVNGAQIGGQMDFEEAVLDGNGHMALHAQGVTVGQSLFFRSLKATGTVAVNAAEIGGQMDCTGAVLHGKGGTALLAQELLVKAGLFWRNVAVKQGMVSFSSAHVGGLVDDIGSWPKGADQLVLDGFTYDRITDAPTDAKRRLNWLETGAVFGGTLYPQPYTQLAKVLAQMGHHRDARKVLERRARLLGTDARLAAYRRPDGSFLAPLEKPGRVLVFLVSWLFDRVSQLVVGYGFAPHRALYSLSSQFLLATFLVQLTWTEGSFAPNSDVILTSPGWTSLVARDCVPDRPYGPCLQNPAAAWSSFGRDGLDWDTFNRYGYAADLVIPILSLGQTQAWAPSKDRGPMGKTLWWGRWVLEALGWLVTALGVAAITGIMQRNAPEWGCKPCRNLNDRKIPHIFKVLYFDTPCVTANPRRPAFCR